MLIDMYGFPLKAQASTEAGHEPYRAASRRSQELGTMRPALLSADREIRPARDMALSRTRYLEHNDPHAAAAVTRLVDMLIGAGLRLVAKPDYRALGISVEQARGVRAQIEAEYRLATQDPRFLFDSQRRMSLNGRFRQLAHTWVTGREVCIAMRWRQEDLYGARYRTNIQAIDPDRLSTPPHLMESTALRNGVALDGNGAPIGYWVRDAHPSDWLSVTRTLTWTYVQRETAWGRPVFIHGFEGQREDQTRSITAFASVVESLKMTAQHRRHEINNAAANALYAAFIKSNMSLSDATGMLHAASETFAESRDGYWADVGAPVVNGVRIPVMPIGDELVMNNAPRQTAAFETFQRTFLRSIAAALGLSYEQLTMDWSQVNYSSARAALNEVWRGVRRDFASFVEQVVTPVYLAFLEEAFDRYIEIPKGAPSFWEMPAAWASARWIGSPRGYVDPVKEAQSANLRVDGLISTLEAENAEQGLDWEETIEQQSYEQALLVEKGVRRVSATMVTADETPTDDKPNETPPEDKPKSEQQA